MREVRQSTSLLLCCAAALMCGSFAGCRPEPFPLPDPDAEVPPASCDGDVALGLISIHADSNLVSPPWQQLCTLCPADSIVLRIVDEDGNEAPLVSAWAKGGQCAVSMPQAALSPAQEWSIEAVLVDGERSGSFDAALELSEQSTTPPLDLGSGIWLARGDLEGMRLPSLSAQLDPGLPELQLPTVLIGLSTADKNGGRRLWLAATADDAQDLCQLTTELHDAVLSDHGQLSATFSAGSIFATALGDVVRRGALHATLRGDSLSLSTLVILAVLDVDAMAAASGGSAEETCAGWQEQLGSDPCVPCADPGEAFSAPSHCITTVLEWTDLAQVPVPLQPVSAESISPDCPTP